MRVERAQLSTPLGPMVALASPDGLCALEFDTNGRLSRLSARLARFYQQVTVVDGWNDTIASTRAWLEAYFAGTPIDHHAIPLDARGTPFERSVWTALRTIAPGTSVSYGHIARQIGSPSASRAVGLANGANPIAIIVPCHRVIGAGGTLVGYGGGLERKRWLLEHEQRHWAGAPSEVSPRQASRVRAAGRLPFDS